MNALDRPVIFHPSRLLKWKGVTVGLEAFAELRTRLGAGTLVFCASRQIVDGAAEVEAVESELLQMAENLGVADYIRFLEFGREDMPAAYRCADLAWYPTLDHEPLGLAPLEAMASGVPLIVTDSGGMNETVIPGKTGLIVPRKDAKGLFQAASRILLDRNLRTALTSEALQRVQEFEISRYTEALVKIYESCRRARGVPSHSR
jgi:glycogen synthase